ncbi:MAG TPA: hypothetical protein VFO46_03370 [Candidatus Sulfotelmatobacter sp.]|nr:hypothetical protein [Candidatus Sulfotelmatobacter sp.]
MRHPLFIAAAVSLTLTASVSAQDTKHEDMANCSMHAQKETQYPHHADVNRHGDLAMGFPHDKTTHHFRLRSDGGAIEITANDSNDKTNTAAIRAHLSHVAGLFSQGDFSTPMFIHDTIPPGIETMRLLKAAIRYRFEELPTGARLNIESSNPAAVAAVHDFLRFQISDHQTGDPITVADSH